jgi:hypothetical protein
MMNDIQTGSNRRMGEETFIGIINVFSSPDCAVFVTKLFYSDATFCTPYIRCCFLTSVQIVIPVM